MAKDARNRGARVFIASLTPPRAGGRNAMPADAVTSYNDRLRASPPARTPFSWISTRRSSATSRTYIGVDGLHPTEVGYQKIAETFFAAIQATLQNPVACRAMRQ